MSVMIRLGKVIVDRVFYPFVFSIAFGAFCALMAIVIVGILPRSDPMSVIDAWLTSVPLGAAYGLLFAAGRFWRTRLYAEG